MLFVACGCGQGGDWFPLEEGKSWTYQVQNGYRSFVERVEVGESMSVAGSRGFELRGPMGVSRLAWNGGVLWADRLSGATPVPPLPLLTSRADKDKLAWKGIIEFAGGKETAHGVLTQGPDRIKVGLREVPALKTRLLLVTVGGQVELLTWYVQGKGPVRQEQRNDGRLVVALAAVQE